MDFDEIYGDRSSIAKVMRSEDRKLVVHAAPATAIYHALDRTNGSSSRQAIHYEMN